MIITKTNENTVIYLFIYLFVNERLFKAKISIIKTQINALMQ